MPQQKYLCIQRSQPREGGKPSPAQMEEMYAKFNAWKDGSSAESVGSF